MASAEGSQAAVRAIAHVDMDAFYAAVEVRDDPSLRGLPVVVGGDPGGRGVVAAASYEARAFGIHSAMPAATARRLCPGARFLRPRMSHYVDVSRQIREIFHAFTPLVEPLSLDEAFLDLTGVQRLFGPAEQIAQAIRGRIREELGLVASLGLASNKFLAKLASDLDKPDGFVVVSPGTEREFLAPLPVSRLWGVGRVARQRLEALGIHTVGDLQRTPTARLSEALGRSAEHLKALARGIDDRPVVSDHEAKSISHEVTFPRDIDDRDELSRHVGELSEQVAIRLRRAGRAGRTVTLKLRYDDFQTITRSTTLPRPTDLTREVRDAALAMLAARLPRRRLSVRLIGVGVSGLGDGAAPQGELFGEPERSRERAVDAVSDLIRERFGPRALRRGGTGGEDR